MVTAVVAPLIVGLFELLVVADGTAQVVTADVGPVAQDGAMVARLLTDTGVNDEFDLL